MTTLSNSATYQGFPVKEVHFRRSEGFSPEMGSVVVDYSVLNSLELKSDAVPWRASIGGADGPGALGMHVWWNLFGKRAPGTPTKRPAPSAGAGTSLNLYGPLVLTTVVEGGEAEPEVQYQDIYVENAEEVADNLARAREHKLGEIRIDITDIRRFYPKYGTIISRINCRLENGKYDPRTIKKPPAEGLKAGTVTEEAAYGEPWSFEDVLRYLFSQLPGTPAVLGFPTLGKLPPPEEIDRVGAPAVSVIQEVLDRYGLVAKLQPNNDYYLTKRASEWLKPGEVAPDPGERRAVSRISYETKSVSRPDIPAVVMVLGQPRIRRETLTCVPCFHDIDGKLYRLVDIDRVWDGYSLEQACLQAASVSPAFSFQDVPPRPFFRAGNAKEFHLVLQRELGVQGTTEGAEQDELHYARRTIMRKEAFYVYAPEALFAGAPKNKKGAPYWEPGRFLEYAPLMPYPVLESQLKDQIPGRSLGIKGDKGKMVIVDPTVYATTIQESFWPEPEMAIASLKKVIDGGRSHLRTIETEAAHKLDDLRAGADRLKRANSSMSFGRHLENELFRSDTFGSQGRLPQDYIKQGTLDMAAMEREKLRLEGDIAVLKVEHKNVAQNIKLWTAQLDELASLFQTAGGIEAMAQTPWGKMPRGSFTVDPMTGIVNFATPYPVLVTHPMCVFDVSSFRFVSDGCVTITFGHQLANNEVTDYTSVLFMRDKNGTTKACGANRSSQIKPMVMHAPDLVMYEGPDGDPLNLKDCIDQARKKAATVLEGPTTATGYTTTFSGFVKCILERGVNSVQHTWDGDAAHTFVAVNAPRVAGPEGPASMRD